MEADIAPFKADGSVEMVRANLEGAKYTLAVPKYLADEGLKDFADIAKFKDQLDGQIYGIEPGNDGNRLIQKMIDEGQFGLAGFELVESSEQGMLAQVQRASRGKKPIVFLGWEPHPMNTNFELAYLTGGDEVFGPNFGGATVYTNVRKGYLAGVPQSSASSCRTSSSPCRWRARSWAASSTTARSPRRPPRQWLKANPGVLDGWLAGVTTFDGGDGLAAVKAQPRLLARPGRRRSRRRPHRRQDARKPGRRAPWTG